MNKARQGPTSREVSDCYNLDHRREGQGAPPHQAPSTSTEVNRLNDSKSNDEAARRVTKVVTFKAPKKQTKNLTKTAPKKHTTAEMAEEGLRLNQLKKNRRQRSRRLSPRCSRAQSGSPCPPTTLWRHNRHQLEQFARRQLIEAPPRR
ncbi:hypothetical protein FRC12_025043 [Ceratobasidium sp. 428]|nr:hypothetical protein FRC12_025043 [Ceratobasidium sp. 428]